MDSRLKEAETAIDRLLKVIADTDAFDDPVSLSNIMVRLSYSNHIIGRGLAALQAAYRQKRSDVYNEVMQDKDSKVTHAKQKAEEASYELEKEYDHYKNVHEDTQTFINVCQSHLRVLGMEAKNQI